MDIRRAGNDVTILGIKINVIYVIKINILKMFEQRFDLFNIAFKERRYLMMSDREVVM